MILTVFRPIINLTIRFRALLLLLVLSGCTTAPVQEMSDARQAIRAAEDVGAEQHSPDEMNHAYQLLDQAQQSLQNQAYQMARQQALDARDEAIRARERALALPSQP